MSVQGGFHQNMGYLIPNYVKNNGFASAITTFFVVFVLVLIFFLASSVPSFHMACSLVMSLLTWTNSAFTDYKCFGQEE